MVVYDSAALYAQETPQILRYKENAVGARRNSVIEKIRIPGRAIAFLSGVARTIDVNAFFPWAVIRAGKGPFICVLVVKLNGLHDGRYWVAGWQGSPPSPPPAMGTHSGQQFTAQYSAEMNITFKGASKLFW